MGTFILILLIGGAAIAAGIYVNNLRQRVRQAEDALADGRADEGRLRTDLAALSERPSTLEHQKALKELADSIGENHDLRATNQELRAANHAQGESMLALQEKFEGERDAALADVKYWNDLACRLTEENEALRKAAIAAAKPPVAKASPAQTKPARKSRRGARR